jgi:hypothetical protein
MRTGSDAWTRLGALGALFASSVVLVQLPISLWAGNAAEFQSSPWQLLALAVAAVLAVVIGFTGLLRLLPLAPRRLAASAVCAVGLVAWVQGNFLVGKVTVLNGQGAPVDFTSGHQAWTMLAVVVAFMVVAFAVSRAPLAAFFGLTVLTIGLYVTAIVAIATSPKQEQERQRQGGLPASVYRFSSRENVLVLLLDGLQSDVAAAILRSSSSIAQAFDGFQYYPDTAGVARTTFLSLPAIHSGMVYSPQQTPARYFVDAIARRSFMNRFADAGFDTVLVNPVEGICPDRVSVCATASDLLYTMTARLKHESLQLFDLSLFRASPALLKRYIYNDGEWLTASRMDVPYEIARVLEGNQLLERLSSRLTVDDGAPTMKFVHIFSTHTPYVLNADCHTYATTSLDHLVPQARCGLLAVVSLLDRLKATGTYDNTVIALLADHGVDPGVYGWSSTSDTEQQWRHLAGAANPVFLMKPQGSRGPLTQMNDAVHVPDLGNMLCMRSHTCRIVTPVQAIKPSPTRLRHFDDYEWRHEYWRLRTIDKLTSYEIRGPVWKRSSWSRQRPDVE